jgi:hypothetical protein
MVLLHALRLHFLEVAVVNKAIRLKFHLPEPSRNTGRQFLKKRRHFDKAMSDESLSGGAVGEVDFSIFASIFL